MALVFAVARPLLSTSGVNANMNSTESSTLAAPAHPGEHVLSFPAGLLGFESFKRYVLLARPEEAPFLWLRVVDRPEVAFLVVSPTVVAPGYAPEVSNEDTGLLDLRTPADALIFNIVTLHDTNHATVNLKGPVLVNRRTLVGKQVIPLNAGDFSVCQPIPVRP